MPPAARPLARVSLLLCPSCWLTLTCSRAGASLTGHSTVQAFYSGLSESREDVIQEEANWLSQHESHHRIIWILATSNSNNKRNIHQVVGLIRDVICFSAREQPVNVALGVSLDFVGSAVPSVLACERPQPQDPFLLGRCLCSGRHASGSTLTLG